MATSTSNPAGFNKLKLETNLPEVIALKFSNPLVKPSNYGGDQLMYSLVDGRSLFLPPVVEAKINALGLAAGEYFQICKREVEHGNRRGVEYQVERIAPAGIRAIAPPAPSPMPAAAAAAVPVATGPPETVAAPTALPATQTMFCCYEAAIEVALVAVTSAKDHGLLLSPTFSDIASIAATFFISETRKGGR
jgi:hypothetical protein